MQQIQDKVIDILVQRLSVQPTQVRPESRLIEDLGADSLDVVEIVMQLEETFGIEITDEQAESVRTVSELLEQLKR
jgi:acyl carrier protein